MNYKNGFQKIEQFFSHLKQRNLEEKLYLFSLIPLGLFFLLSCIEQLVNTDVSLFKWAIALTFVVMVALGYISAITSLILRNLKSGVVTAALGVLIFFYYQIIDSLSDHLIHLATGLNPDYFDNSHYFINLLVGITLSSLLIALLLFPLTLITSVIQTMMKFKHKSIEKLVVPRVVASFIIIIAGYSSYYFSMSNLESNTQKIIVYSDYYLGSKCPEVLSRERVRYLNGNNISVAIPNKDENRWIFEERKCSIYN